jgi:hypothetical protein
VNDSEGRVEKFRVPKDVQFKDFVYGPPIKGQTHLNDWRTEGGTFLPNEVIDLYAKHLGPRGLSVYLHLARCVTTREYPGIDRLSRMTRISKPAVRNALYALASFGLLTKHDIKIIFERTDE